MDNGGAGLRGFQTRYAIALRSIHDLRTIDKEKDSWTDPQCAAGKSGPDLPESDSYFGCVRQPTVFDSVKMKNIYGSFALNRKLLTNLEYIRRS